MATSYTSNVKLQKPATSDRNWDVPVNANADSLDAMTALGALAVTPTETPSATLDVDISAGSYLKSDGTVLTFTGLTTFSLPASSTVSLWLDDFGVLSSGTDFPTSAHLRLASATTGPTSILQIFDERIQCSIGGTPLAFVLKTGDTIVGPLFIVTPSTNTALVVADPIHRLIGFFGVTPASQAPVLTPLVANSSGVASDTLLDVGSSFSQSTLNNNFASLAAKVDALIATLQLHGLMGR